MSIASRPLHSPELCPRAVWLTLATIALVPVPVWAQDTAPPPAVPTLSNPLELDPAAPLAPMPEIGVAWPDMGAPDTVEPLAAAAPDELVTDPVAADVGIADAQEADAPVADTPVSQVTDFDAGAERRYRVNVQGLDGISDTLFTTRFDELSVLKQGDGKPANLAQINRRIKEDTELLDRLMRAKGYYDARVRTLVSAATDDRLQVTLTVVPGPLYLLASVDLQGLAETGPREQTLREAFTVKVGDPVDADRIVGAQTSLAAALGNTGFPFAKVEEPVVRVDHDARKGDLDVIIETGGYRTFGRIVLPDDDLFSARHVQRIARFKPGDTYTASDVEDLRRALVATGLVSSVTLTPKDAGDGEHVDLAVDVAAAPPRTIAGEIGYGTGEGARIEASWQHRNFFPPEGAVTVRGVLGTQEQTGSLTYRRNNFKKRDQVLTGLLSVSNIKRDAFDARTVQLSGSLERQTNIIFQKKWVWSVGAELVASDERDSFSRISGGRRTFFIGALPTGLTYDGSDDLLNPTTGFRLGGRLSPELSFQDSTFGYVRAQLDGSAYRQMTDRIVLAGRARLGTIFGSTVSQIAPSRRFYAGGGGSVRGYGFQAIGPRDMNNDPIGGKSLAEFSLEARVRFGNFGVVPFVDAGNISTQALPRFRDLRVGAGVGVRYYSSFGPIRVDVGTPINPQRGDSRIAVYVSLGQAF
ncbi:MAG: BamA/TamA family outer membrane protein [Sphingobium sp.]|uniref:autotransporter assembly complex protein TamA n=1 Tax=Sphingobium sp. TaxID=1912891 RepID=UPI0029BD8FF8|nr:BamA/TamA family outer membrane protein [Sphingobium sp.]MDX3908827.1 BamA/TamA family outer membrane protein [Sphingobium sp.]